MNTSFILINLGIFSLHLLPTLTENNKNTSKPKVIYLVFIFKFSKKKKKNLRKITKDWRNKKKKEVRN